VPAKPRYKARREAGPRAACSEIAALDPGSRASALGRGTALPSEESSRSIANRRKGCHEGRLQHAITFFPPKLCGLRSVVVVVDLSVRPAVKVVSQHFHGTLLKVGPVFCRRLERAWIGDNPLLD